MGRSKGIKCRSKSRIEGGRDLSLHYRSSRKKIKRTGPNAEQWSAKRKREGGTWLSRHTHRNGVFPQIKKASLYQFFKEREMPRSGEGNLYVRNGHQVEWREQMNRKLP